MSTIMTREKKVSYFREVQNELRRVTWVSKPELILFTKVVVLSTIFFGFAIFTVDLGIRGVLNLLSSLMRMVIG